MGHCLWSQTLGVLKGSMQGLMQAFSVKNIIVPNASQNAIKRAIAIVTLLLIT